MNKLVMKTALAFSALIAFAASTPAMAATLYSDAFSSTSDLSGWSSIYNDAKVVSAPGGGLALSFSQTHNSGDLSSPSGSYGTGSFTVSFDFYGACNYTSSCGFFLATTPDPAYHWFLSDTGLGTAVIPDSNGSWEHVSYTFAATSLTGLGMENYDGSDHAAPYSFFLRNLVLTSNPSDTVNGTLTVSDVSAVPEPSIWAMMLVGLGGLGVALRGQRRNQEARVSAA